MSVFTLSQHAYAYGVPPPPPPPPAHYASHSNSSAFSSSANPDEDWTKISDLAERRRIQNRIAQRNYRKKLKRRLEDLERRAGSSDEAENEKVPTPAPKHTKASSTQARRTQGSSRTSKRSPKSTVASSHGQYTPPMEHPDEIVFSSPAYRDHHQHHHHHAAAAYHPHHQASSREGPPHTPPMFSYGMPMPEDLLMNPYGSAAAGPGYPAISSADSYHNYMVAGSAVPVTLPSMTHFSDAVKRDPYADEDAAAATASGMSPYLSYGYAPGPVDMSLPSHYDHHSSNSATSSSTADPQRLQTPPLSHSYDHSATCSDAGYEYPTTPLSLPTSPENNGTSI